VQLIFLNKLQAKDLKESQPVAGAKALQIVLGTA